MSRCSLCLEDVNTVKAHILPKSVLKKIGFEEDPNLKVLTEKGTIKRPGGSYDPNILCGLCDKGIGIYDKYIGNFIKRNDFFTKQNIKGVVFLANADTAKIKLFILSFIWRASLSGLKEFSGINLGKYHTERIRKILLNPENIWSDEAYEVILCKFAVGDLPYSVNKQVIFPARSRPFGEGVNCMEGYMPNLYKFYAKIDRRKLNEQFQKFVISPANELLILERGEYRKSQDFEILRNLVSKN